MANRKLLVLKFGGTSMGSTDAISRVIEIIRTQNRSSRVVTVVSAMAGVTDKLLSMGQEAMLGKATRVDQELKSLRLLHEQTFTALNPLAGFQKWARGFLDKQFSEIREISHGIYLLREFSNRTQDKLLSYGEVLSSNLLARALEESDARFCHSDARRWIVAEPTRQGPVVDFQETERRIHRYLSPHLKRGLSPVVPGFVCSTRTGQTGTLGRNGSDYSAAIVGAALRAEEIWIFTDVDGIMTADPTLVTEAAILSQISYQEAAEMSYFGAKVLHPKTMIPAVFRRIPIRIKNTFNPAAEGTLVAEKSLRRPVVKTVTSVRDLALINIQGNGMVGIPGVSSRVFAVLAREGISVMMISQSSSEHNICLVIQAGDASRAVGALREEFQLEIDRNLIEEIEHAPRIAIVSIIGAGMRGTPGISGKFFDALGKHRINVLAIAQGSSELNISAAILERDYRPAVQAIHTAFGLTKDLHVFLFGCGNIGKTLLKQIHENRKQIAKSLQVNLKVLGVANSRNWIFSSSGLNDSELELLASGAPLGEAPGAQERPANEEIFHRIAGTYKSDIILVDATGADLAPTHIEGLRRGFHVVTANKKPLTSRLQDYRAIHSLRRSKGLNYQYEATFGAGLPLLYTLQDLLNTGDRVLRIHGCLSGTLGFLCSRLDEGVPFSRALSDAMSQGFTEPDPRDDLSGIDVARKALIIARELGIPIELEQVQLQAMIPARFFRLRSVKIFLEKLPAVDGKMSALVEKAHAEGKVLRFLADITTAGCVVGLRRVQRDTPVGRLAGPDNILVFQTQRYFHNSLVIQGPGAGGGVTAAGVLSDILKIAKSI